MRFQATGAVFLLLAFGSPVREESEDLKVRAARTVAERYYALLPETRDGKIPRPSQPVATGLVVDRRGRPVADAQVVIQDWDNERHGEGRTGADGRFEIPYSNPEDKMGLTVTAPGFERWAVAAGYEPHELVEYRVRLDREIGSDFLASNISVRSFATTTRSFAATRNRSGPPWKRTRPRARTKSWRSSGLLRMAA